MLCMDIRCLVYVFCGLFVMRVFFGIIIVLFFMFGIVSIVYVEIVMLVIVLLESFLLLSEYDE